MERARLTIEGMSCGHCVRAVTRVLGEVEGVQVERVEVGSAEVQFDAAATSLEQMASVVQDEGYQVATIGRVS